MSEQEKPLQFGEVLKDEAVRLNLLQAQDIPAGKPDTDEFLHALQEKLLDAPGKSAALCFSGGGIRSATFNLGVLQGLARLGLLDKFHYLSTVSGGGYIGGWLKAWQFRHLQGLNGVSAELPQAPESWPLTWLRKYSNYMAPRLGILSADGWTLAATFLRNLVLNWLLLVPLLGALLLLPRLLVATGRHDGDGPFSLILLLAAVAGIVLALWFARGNLPSRNPAGYIQAQFLRRCLLPSAVSILLFTLAWTWYGSKPLPESLVCWLFAGGIAIHVVSAFGQRKNQLKHMAAGLVAGSVAGALAWWWTVIFPDPAHATATGFVSYLVWGPALLWFFLLLSETLYIGLASRITNDDDREWWARSGGWTLIAITCWILLGGFSLLAPLAYLAAKGWLHSYIQSVPLATLLSGAYAAWAGHSARTPAKADVKAQSSALDKLFALSPLAAAVIFSLLLLTLLAYALDWLTFGQEWPQVGVQHYQALLGATLGGLLLWLAVLAVPPLFLAKYFNVNKFSLHSMYRQRLMRAYLGASRPEGGNGRTAAESCMDRQARPRDPNRFTGFDPCDNVDMAWLAEPVGMKPLLVVNTALNLTHGDRIAWQQRKASSFSITPLHCGSRETGYRASHEFGGTEGGITLATAVAISGAAVNPNAGYHSSPPVSFLMTLFNARLGWWLGNPKYKEIAKQLSPGSALKPLLSELFSLTNAESPWINLSDGGHFENLGVYEMVARRCRLIVVCDAGADPERDFEDFANAIRKIRADFGIPITAVGEMRIGSSDLKPAGNCWALYCVEYSKAHPGKQDGQLLYIKPAYYEMEPAASLLPLDVRRYAAFHQTFPHEPTLDQFFSEEQFESYRALGLHIVGKLAGEQPLPGLEQLFQAAQPDACPNL